MKHAELGLRLVRLQVHLAHAPQLLERLVDVAHADPLASVVGVTAMFLLDDLFLGRETFVVAVIIRSIKIKKSLRWSVCCVVRGEGVSIMSKLSMG